jgi:hypothetical protein
VPFASITDGKGTNSSILFWDGSHEIVSTTINRHDLLVPMIFVGVLSLFGIPGNILVILVFTICLAVHHYIFSLVGWLVYGV